MSDPIDQRLRDYYRSIETDAPSRLEARAAGAMTADASDGAPRRALRFAAAAVAAVAIVAIVATLALRAVSPSPAETASIGPTPTPTSSPSATPTNPPPTASPTPAATETATASPTASPAPSESLAPTPTPPLSALGTFGAPFGNSIGRSGYTATALDDGRVLIAGGLGDGSGSPVGPLSIAQIWDPATGKFTSTGSLVEPRCQHTATLLNDGRVLVAGGADLMDGIDNQKSAELYDPRTGRFTKTGSMSQGRAFHTATRLEDGSVLIVGGYGGGTDPVASAELYDPATGKFAKTGSMSVARDRHTATYVSGKVLIAGGMGLESALASAELYDPSSGRFTPTKAMTTARYGQAAAAFSTADHPEVTYVLVAGGNGRDGKALASAEIFVESEGDFAVTTPMHLARSSPQAVTPGLGFVLVVGGNGKTTTADFFEPGGTFRATGPLSGAGETATVFGECQVLLSAPGGKTWQVFTATECPPAT